MYVYIVIAYNDKLTYIYIYYIIYIYNIMSSPCLKGYKKTSGGGEKSRNTNIKETIGSPGDETVAAKPKEHS